MSEILAQEATPSGGGSSLIIFAIMALAFYFLFVRPQRKRQSQIQSVQKSLEIGADVRTIGGIHGRVVDLGDDSVVLEVESGRIRIARKGIASSVSSES
jgi:preprotein translocase subunit YajC